MNKYDLVFWCVFAVLAAIIWWCNKYFNMLKDVSDAPVRPYSYARVQLAWWTLIILSSFISIYFVTGQIATFSESAIILLGISAGTTTAASLIDASDQSKNIPLSQDHGCVNFFLDILSDNNGVSIHRLQAVIFNLVFGAWFLQQVSCGLSGLADGLAKCAGTLQCKIDLINAVMPVVTPNNLILLGVSSGTYAALKTNENKPGMQSAPNNPAPGPAPAAAQSGNNTTSNS